MTDRYVHVRYRMPDDEWHSAYFETDAAAEAFALHLTEDMGYATDYQGHVEVDA